VDAREIASEGGLRRVAIWRGGGILFGHMDGEEWAVGSPSFGDASAVAAPRSCHGCLIIWQAGNRWSVGWVWNASFFVGFGCRYPPRSIVVLPPNIKDPGENP
jgi:hypothetical protein